MLPCYVRSRGSARFEGSGGHIEVQGVGIQVYGFHNGEKVVGSCLSRLIMFLDMTLIT